MSVLDSNGNPVNTRNNPLAPIIQGLNVLHQRSEAQQMQLVQLGLLVEFLIEKMTTPDASGKPLLTFNQNEFETWSSARFEEIKQESERRMNASPTPAVNLEG